ncbi:MAG: hypothetical protein QXS18_04945 [Thermoplasmata archaeon]
MSSREEEIIKIIHDFFDNIDKQMKEFRSKILLQKYDLIEKLQIKENKNEYNEIKDLLL